MSIDPFGPDPEEQERIKALKRERATDLAGERAFAKRTRSFGFDAATLSAITSKPRRQKKKQTPKKLPLAQRIEEQTKKLTVNASQDQMRHRMKAYQAFQYNPAAYATMLLSQRTLRGLTYQIPSNWQELFAPLLYNNHIRASYITKAVGMCSIRTLFDLADDAIKKFYKKGYFNVEEGNKKGLGEGRRAHSFFEQSILSTADDYEYAGKKVSRDWTGFLAEDTDFTVVSEYQLETMLILEEFPMMPVYFTGKPDLIFGKGKDRKIHGVEAKTHVHNYSAQYLIGCVLQGLAYLHLSEDRIKRYNPSDKRDYVLHVVESLRPYTATELDSYVVEDDSVQFIKNLEAQMSLHDSFDKKTRVILPWDDSTKHWLYSTLTDLLIHRLNPRLFEGTQHIEDCHRFGGCKYIKAGCRQYLKLQTEHKNNQIPFSQDNAP